MRYVANEPITLRKGAAVKLSVDQARRRRHLVAPAVGKSGWFEVIAPELQLKAGEAFELEHELPKGTVSVQVEGRTKKADAKQLAAATEASADVRKDD